MHLRSLVGCSAGSRQGAHARRTATLRGEQSHGVAKGAEHEQRSVLERGWPGCAATAKAGPSAVQARQGNGRKAKAPTQHG